jgi:hypothetical protein
MIKVYWNSENAYEHLKNMLAPKKVSGLTPWSRVLLKKLTVNQSRNSPPFMEPEGSLPCSQGPATEPDASCPHLPTLFP